MLCTLPSAAVGRARAHAADLGLILPACFQGSLARPQRPGLAAPARQSQPTPTMEDYDAKQRALIADGALCARFLQEGLDGDRNFEAAQLLLLRHHMVDACLGAQPRPKMLAALAQLDGALNTALIQLELELG